MPDVAVTGLMSQDSVLMGLFVSVLALSFTFVLSARLRQHRTLFDGLAGSTDAANERAIGLLKKWPDARAAGSNTRSKDSFM